MFPHHRGPAPWRLAAFAFALATCLTAILPGSARARTWRITTDGTGDAPTIQAGIDSAIAGDIVLLAPGTYTWTQQQASLPSMLRLAPSITLRGEAGAPATILDAEGSGRVLECVDAGQVVIEDLSFRNGLAPAENTIAGRGATTGCGATVGRGATATARAPDDSHGGAIDARGVTTPTIRRCVFVNNIATGGVARGGAIACDLGLIEDCEFSSNQAGIEGPTNGQGGAVHCGNAEIRRCTFRGNRVRGFEAAGGGAVYTSSATITDCVFEDNYVRSAGSTQGGAVRAAGSPTVSRCTFRRNIVDGHYFTSKAGALYIGTGSIEDCLFLDNVAQCEDGPGQGGAVVGAEFSVVRSIFVGNSALRTIPHGAGFGGAIYALFHCTIDACTFVGNSGGTPEGVGCIDLQDGGTLRGVLITDTVVGQTCRGDATWTCSILFGNAGGNTPCDPDGGPNFIADPLFCNDPRIAGDVSVRSNSPCAGNRPAGCDRIGAGEVACEVQAVEARTWSAVKSLYRPDSR